MKNIFLSHIMIEKVRHLENISILLPKDKMTHLIFTGRNGSGKTSVLDALSRYLDSAATTERIADAQNFLQQHQAALTELQQQGVEDTRVIDEEKAVERYTNELNQIKCGISVEFNEPVGSLRYSFEKGEFVLAYYKADRIFKADIPKHVEKVELKEKYSISDAPRQEFVKYLLDLKVTQALAKTNGNVQKAENIENWFDHFESLLKKVFEDESLKLVFEEDTFKFYIQESKRELFDFNTLSSGFAAVLDIVLDLIMRMEKATSNSFDFNVPGIVLIDEIETHLHLEMQKQVLGFLTTVFPNIQFVVSTHSPFILGSLDNVVIYDLENNIEVRNGLANVPYEGIVEGYFGADLLSDELRAKYSRFKELTAKSQLTDDDFEEIADLELYLDEIPDYLALDITTEYQRLKAEFEKRDDIEWSK